MRAATLSQNDGSFAASGPSSGRLSIKDAGEMRPNRARSLRGVDEGDLSSKFVECGLLLHMQAFDVLKRGLQV